jgi:Regulator of ribonuclease activity B
MSMFDLLHENLLADNDLLFKNDARGDMFAKPRFVDFAFKTTDRTKADDLCEYVNGKNCGLARVDEGNDQVFWIIVQVDMPITQNVLCCVSAFMLCLSRLFTIEYDGWGSVIQSS